MATAFETYVNTNLPTRLSIGAGPAADTYPRFTGAGRITTARTAAEVRTDLNVADGADVTGSNPPQAHAASHLSGGSDSIKLDDLAAPDDNTDLDFSTTKHGLCPKGTNLGKFLKDDGTWDTPAGGSTHDLLSATHTDTLAAAVIAGDIMIGNATPKWARLAKGTLNYVLKMGATLPAWGQVAWGEVTGKPSTFTPSAHAASHQHGGSDEVATATPGANAIPKAGAGGKLAAGWLQEVLAYADLTDDPVGTHAGAADPHTGYQKESEKDAANGYAGLSAGSKIALAQIQEVMAYADLTDDPYADHSARHENAGADEISVAGLSGELADNQPPKPHGSAAHTGTIGEVSFQAVITMDDTTVATNKGRWKVSLPSGAGTVTIFKHRAVVGANLNYTSHGTAMVFDVNLNGTSKGTVTIAASTASGDADVSDYTVADGDRITIDKDSGPNEGSVHQIILIGKQQLKTSISS